MHKHPQAVELSLIFLSEDPKEGGEKELISCAEIEVHRNTNISISLSIGHARSC